MSKKITTTTTVVTVEEVETSNRLEITVILDRSGSMQAIRGDVIGGFNSYIEDQKRKAEETGHDVRVSLIQFDDKYQVDYTSKPVADVEPLTVATFVPRGYTALLDAIGKAVTEAETRQANNRVNNLVVIFTDGHENSSKEFKGAQLKSLIEAKTKGDWTFVYLGADQDAWAVGGDLGFSKGNVLSFCSDQSRGTLETLSAATSAYVSSGGLRTRNFFADGTNDVNLDVQGTVAVIDPTVVNAVFGGGIDTDEDSA